MRFALVFSLGLFAGCVGKVDEDNYAEKVAEAACRVQKECAAGSFYDEWDDTEDCVDDLMDQAEDYEDYFDDCDFDAEKAESCVKALNEVSCQDYEDTLEDAYEDCAEIWDCGDAGGPLPYGYDSGFSYPG